MINIIYTEKIRRNIIIPPDKSLSHRCLLFSVLSKKTNTIKNILKSEDIFSSFNFINNMGCSISGDFENLTINPPKNYPKEYEFYCSNSGTTARLISGILSSIKGEYIIRGDSSLSKRPMNRISEPLSKMGASFYYLDKNNYLPIKIIGNNLNGLNYKMIIQSAQVKSSILLAGLKANGQTIIENDNNTRNHTENIFKLMNADIKIMNKKIILNPSELKSLDNFFIPGDFSSASFLICLALLHNNCKIKIKNVGLNPTRIGFLDTIKKMNANIYYNIKDNSLEPYGDIYVESSSLNGIKVDSTIIPSMIDELPLIALLGIFAKGETVLRNSKELIYKESNRLKSIVNNFRNLGVNIIEYNDGFSIKGPQKITKGKIDSYHDHRIVMMFSILNYITKGKIVLKNKKLANISFPGFYEIIKNL